MSLLTSRKFRIAVAVCCVIALASVPIAWQLRHVMWQYVLQRMAVPTGYELAADNMRIPTVYITTPKEPWKKGEKIDGEIEIKGRGVIEDIPRQPISIHVRGNGTSTYLKRAYTFKTQKKIKIGELDKGKKFVLLANYCDPTILHTQAAMKVGELMGIPYVNHIQPVNVVVNGDHRGVYDLTEKLGAGRNGLNIDESNGGLFIELNSGLKVRSGYGFEYPGHDSKIWCEVHAPDSKKMPVDTVALKSELTSMFEAMAALNPSDSAAVAHVSGLIDIESLAGYALLQNVVGNDEWTGPRGLHLYRRDRSDKWHLGPIWDFDRSFGYSYGNEDDWVNTPQTVLPYVRDTFQLFPPVFIPSMSTEEFKQHFSAKWDRLKTDIPEACEYIDRQADLLIEATAANADIWPYRFIDLRRRIVKERECDSHKNAEQIKAWLRERVEFMDTAANWGMW